MTLAEIGLAALNRDKHARAAWKGKAYVQRVEGAGICICGNDMVAPYATSFEDLMADDWEVV